MFWTFVQKDPIVIISPEDTFMLVVTPEDCEEIINI